jgi:hypothetical protein
MIRTTSRIPLQRGRLHLQHSEKERVVQAPPAPPIVAQVPADRVVTYPEGRWTLYGDGTTTSPHYWVWVPAGATPPPPPPLPRR